MMKKFFFLLILAISLFANQVSINLSPKGQKELKKYIATLYILKHYYVKKYDYSELINKSIQGLLNEFDPHTMYLSPKEMKLMKRDTTGKYVGIGIVVTKVPQGVKILTVFPKSPSQKAGIKPGDIIVKVNGKLINKLNLIQIVGRIKGKAGTYVSLTLFRPSNKKFIKVKVKREKIVIPSVNKKKIKGYPDILYVKVRQFDNREPEELKKIISKYMKSTKKPKGIILDLRNNPGGLLTSAVKTLSLFLPKGTLIIIKGRKGKHILKVIKNEKHYTKVPLVVLVNGNTASAAEIVSGTLQYYKRAVIVGTQTFGKGSVQIILPYSAVLGNPKLKDGFKITIARYYLPNGKSIQGEGIKPNIVVKPAIIKFKKQNTLNIKENELDNDQILKVSAKNLLKEKKTKQTSGLNPDKDYQLRTAITVLKTLEFSNSF